MANTLNLQDQEQLDDLKAFWKRYGNLITWLITAVLLAFAGWNGWNWYQRNQSVQAAAMFDELDKAATAGDADKAGRVFNDMKDRYARATLTQQAGLIAARVQYDKGQIDASKATLTWVGEQAAEDEYRAVARLRLAGVLLDAKDHAGALKALDGATAKDFAALVADRRGDVLLAQGKTDEARAAYQVAYKAMDDKIDYRRLVEVKLTALAAPPAPVGAAASGAAK
jgi:predicted negative regulator of RcsB-dependent stress response